MLSLVVRAASSPLSGSEATDLSIRLVYLTNQAQNEQVALFSGIAML
jgi:hypothetical protein